MATFAEPGKAEVQQLMEAMGAMQACMAQIQPDALEQLQRQGEQAEQEVKALCRAGDRASAERRAVEFGAVMGRDPAVQTMTGCIAQLPNLPGMKAAAPTFKVDGEEIGPGTRHVCDREGLKP